MKLIKIFISLTLLITIPCHAMEPEDRIDPAKMALAKNMVTSDMLLNKLE